MFTQGTITHSVYRAVMAGLAFGIPFVLTGSTGWQDITIGTVLMGLAHYAEYKYRSA